jgi:twitching motility two-component system response regulator PilG
VELIESGELQTEDQTNESSYGFDENQVENFAETPNENESNKDFLMLGDSVYEDYSKAETESDVFEIEVLENEQLSDIVYEQESSEPEKIELAGIINDYEAGYELSNIEDSEPVVPASTVEFSAASDSFHSVENEPVSLPDIEDELPYISDFQTNLNSGVETVSNSQINIGYSEVPAADNFEFHKKESITDGETESPIHKSFSPANESLACPFCFVMNEPQSFVCSSCSTMLSLSDLEMLLAYNNARPDVLEMAIEDLEAEKTARQLNETELTNLGIAYLNVKNFRKGLACLQEAAHSNVNNIVLASQVNLLAIRLSEIETQESKSDGVAIRNLTIMVVDDSPTVRKLISGKLEKCGHTVVSAADGMEALTKIKQIVPDLILLDIMMPQMDGYQVCKLIRNNEPTQGVPVIMISGKDGFFDKVRGRMAGTTGFITKPFGPETLMRTIETYVS